MAFIFTPPHRVSSFQPFTQFFLQSHTGSSISLLNTDDVNYTLTPVTLGFLKDMQQTALNKTSFNYKDGNKTIGVSFGNISLDITDFYNEIKSNNKLQEILNFPEDTIKETKICLTGEREYKPGGNYDETPYPRVTELLSIIETPALKGKVKVGKTKLRGNMKNLLPHLVKENNIIEEEYGNITIPGFNETPCSGDLWTGYNGYISKEKQQSILKAEEFWELQERTSFGQTYIRNAIIKNVNLKEELKIRGANWADVTFENSNLSKMAVIGMVSASTTLEFKETTLPYNMEQTSIGHLILKNVTLPKIKIMEYIGKDYFGDINISKLNTILPRIKNSLEIYGYVNDSPLNDLSSEDLEKLKNEDKELKMPYSYKGPEEIYNKLKT